MTGAQRDTLAGLLKTAAALLQKQAAAPAQPSAAPARGLTLDLAKLAEVAHGRR